MNKDILNKDIKEIFNSDIDLKTVIIVIVSALLIGLYGYFGLYPKYRSAKNIKETLKVEEIKLNRYQEKISQIPSIEDKLHDVIEEHNKKSENLSYNMEDGMFLIGLDKKMKEQNVTLVNFDIEKPEHYEKFYAVPTTLKVRGDYRRVRELMYFLEEQKNVTQVLDYDMEVYIEEKDNKENNNNSNTTNGGQNQSTIAVKIPSTAPIYFNEIATIDHMYRDCSLLNNNLPIIEGFAADSSRNPCYDCLVRYNGNVGNTGGNQNQILPPVQPSTKPERPKSNGVIEAEFKFVMYTKENPSKILDIENPALWKTGKFNLFTNTIN